MGPHQKDELGEAAELLLASAARPAFAISLDTLSLLRATPSGRAWLVGLRPPKDEADGDQLDAAMPALVRLRALAAASGSQTQGFWRHERLTFWTAEGVRSPLCAIGVVCGAAGEKVAVVVIESMDVEAVRPQSSLERQAARRDDMATLREIARRIREGQRQLQGTRATDEGLSTPGTLSGGAPLREATGDDAWPLSAAGTREPDDGPVRRLVNPQASGQDAATGDTDPHPTAPAKVRFDKLAHELKTPLSAIAAAAEIMRDERLGPIENARYKSYAADIVESARHALHVIANMLDDHGLVADVANPAALPAMVFTELDLSQIAESLVSSMRPLAEAAGLQLDIQLLPRLPRVIADATAVRQIVLNLLTNAVKFTPTGGRVTLATRYTAGGEVEVEIADTGRGMTREDMARVEDAPERAPAARDGGGLGLGLPLVGALARANGAEVSLSSSEGQGTRVAVVFKRERVVPV